MKQQATVWSMVTGEGAVTVGATVSGATENEKDEDIGLAHPPATPSTVYVPASLACALATE